MKNIAMKSFSLTILLFGFLWTAECSAAPIPEEGRIYLEVPEPAPTPIESGRQKIE